MEQKMKDQIKEKLPRLIKLTICSAEFLTIFSSKSIFSESDIQLIEAEGRNSGALASSRKFYDLLVMRSGSFDVLLKALKETSQTGALAVLEDLSNKENMKTKGGPTKFSSKSPKYITDYVNEQNAGYLIVCSDDCKLTCNRILETTQNCKLYSVTEVLDALSVSSESFDKHIVLLLNLEKNLDPIYDIEENTQLKVVFVTGLMEVDLQEKLPKPTSMWRVICDKIQWTDLSLCAKFRIRSGLKKNLDLTEKLLTNALRNIGSKVLTDLLNDKFPEPENLFCDTIPLQINNYVTRTLQTRQIISKKIFHDELHNNLVLISGLERYLLSEICQDNLPDSSSNLLRSKKPSSQFIYLENELDFNKIVAKFSNYAVHHLQYEGKEFVWKKSKGNVYSIQKYVATKQRTLTESEFLSQTLAKINSCCVCISDTPGKGKSILLAKLANEVKKHNQTGIVAFIIIKELIHVLKENKVISPFTTLSGISQFLSTSTLGYAYLSANKHYLRELFMDGFDEIDADDTDFALECIREIRTVFKNTRIWITTRPHMLPDLERCVETLGYHITPFSKKDQIFFLSSFWEARIENSDRAVLSHFAVQCLKTLKTLLGPTGEDIAGIPLQCLLIGEAYEDDAKRFTKNSKIAIFSQETTTIAHLYQNLIDKKLETFKRRYNSNNLNNPEIFKAHFHMALQILFPSHVNKFSDMLIHSMSRQEILDFGLIEAKSVLSSCEFLHRTFAEYLVALFVSTSLDQNPSYLLLEFLFTELMMTDKTQVTIVERDYFIEYKNDISFESAKFKHNVTCYFLNTFVEEAVPNFTEHVFSVDFEHIRSIAEACVFHNLEHLFTKFLLGNEFKQGVINETILTNAVYWADVHFLDVITTNYLAQADITPITKINCYEELNSDDNYSSDSLESVHIEDKPSFTLLHLAIIKADYATFDYLITNHFRTSVKDSHHITYNNLIRLLLESSSLNSIRVIAEKIHIVNHLTKLNRNLLILENEYGWFPFDAETPHPDLMLVFWKLAKPLYSKTNILIYLLQELSAKMTCKNFYTFIKTVFSDMDKTLITNVLSTGKLCECICEMKGLNKDILNYLKNQCPSFCEVNTCDRISIFENVLYLNDKNILQWLITNLPFTREDFKVVLTYCLLNFYQHGVNVLSICIKRLNSLIKLPTFAEMFAFMFGNRELESVQNIFTVIHLVNFFLWKTHLRHFEKMDFESTLTHLIEIGFSYFDQLVLKSLVSKFDERILKIFWITFLCSKLKTEIFIRRLNNYLKDVDIHESDIFENNLLHTFARKVYFEEGYKPRKSFFDKIQFSKSFKDMHCSYNISNRALDIWKLLVEKKLNTLQCNFHNQTPICLLSYYSRNLHNISDFILFSANYIATQNHSNVEKIHRMLYLVIKSYDLTVVKKVYEVYISFCEGRNVKSENLMVKFRDHDGDVLDAAIKSGNGEVVEFVTDVLHIHVPTILPSPTCIHHSIQPAPYGDRKTVKYITCLEKMFPHVMHKLVNQRDGQSLVPLSLPHITSDIVKLLHNLGAILDANDHKGNTPLHLALININSKIQVDVVRQLVKCGSNVNAKNCKMETPLSILAHGSSIDWDWSLKCFKLLIINKADPTIQDDAGNTIVHHLIKNMYSAQVFHRIVKILILNGFADVLTMINREGQTPLELAEKNFHINQHTRHLLNEHLDLEM